MKAAKHITIMALLALSSITTNWNGGSASFAKSPGPATRVQTSDGRPFKATRLFAINAAQSARLRVSGIRESNRDDSFFRLELSFVDRKGRVISQNVHTLSRTEPAVVDLKGAELLPPGSSQTQLRAMVRFVGTPDTRIAEQLVATLEVLDNQSGKTRLLLPVTQQVQKVRQ